MAEVKIDEQLLEEINLFLIKMVKKTYLLMIILSFFLFVNSVSANNIGLIESPDWESNLTPIRYGSLSSTDLDNNGYNDIILTGCLTASGLNCDSGVISKIYTNNGTTLNENQTWQQNLTNAGWSSTSLGDIDNDGDLDLAMVGCTSATSAGGCIGTILSKIYINNGTSFTESSQWQNNLTAVFDASIKLGDIDNDGDLDLALTGDGGSNKIAKIYINNGTSFTESSQWQNNLTAVRSGSLALGDIDNDRDLDLALTGEADGVTSKTKIYLNNGTSLLENSQWQQNLISTQDSSILFGDIDNDGDLDLALIGVGDYLFLYENNRTTFLVHQKNSGEGGDLGGGLFDGSISFGDYSNDGALDFAGMGLESGRNAIYENNASKNYNFSIDSIAGNNFTIDDMHNGPLIWVDINKDTNLDLIVIGTNSVIGILTRVYISNASSTKNNTQPTLPDTFTSSYSGGVLNLTWNNGSDAETPSNGLYYNLMVGNSTTNHTIVSGIYGGSSGGGTGGGPSSGYFGNMMQRKNISLNKYLAGGTYYWYIQTIDTGLAKSNWSGGQSIVVGTDATAPDISGVSSSVTSSSATITWTTSESANSSVYYGTTTDTTSSSSSTNLVASHSITLSSLSASTLYYYNASSCDYWANCNTSSQYSFTTSAAPVSPGGGGGSSSGGTSGGGSSTTPTPGIKEFDVDFSTTESKTLEAKQGDIKTFSFNGETKHSITLITVAVDSVTLLITSEPISLQIKTEEIKQIDINQDEINDFEIKLISIISGKARFSLTKLEGADIVAKEELGKEALFDVKVSVENWFKVVKSGREVIAKIEVFNVNNIGQVDVIVDYYITSKEDNKTKLAQGSDTLAVEAVASFVRSLRVPYNVKSGNYLFNVDVKYQGKILASGNTEFRVIRNYEIIIAVSIIALIIVAVFVYLWRIKKKEEKLEKKESRLERIVRELKKRRQKNRKKRRKWQK